MSSRTLSLSSLLCRCCCSFCRRPFATILTHTEFCVRLLPPPSSRPLRRSYDAIRPSIHPILHFVSHPHAIYPVPGGANPGPGGDGNPARSGGPSAAARGVPDEGACLPRSGKFYMYPLPCFRVRDGLEVRTRRSENGAPTGLESSKQDGGIVSFCFSAHVVLFCAVDYGVAIIKQLHLFLFCDVPFFFSSFLSSSFGNR